MMILIAEFRGGYQPIGEADSMDEAREIAASYLRRAEAAPDRIAVWGRNFDGDFESMGLLR